MARLDRISVKGYKSIRQLDSLELRPLNVLIGANGSGKTNFISIFKMLNQMINSNLQSYVGKAGGANNLLYFGEKTTQEIVVELVFGQNGYRCTLAPAAGDTLIFTGETCWYHDPAYHDPYTIQLGAGRRETGLQSEARARGRPSVAGHVIAALDSWRVYHFHDTSETALVKKTGDINDNAVLRSDASNLAAFLYWLQKKHANDYQRIVETVQLAAPFLADFVLRPSKLNPDKIQLEWREKGSDDYFNASMLSDGTLRFICLATLLLQPTLPSTILIDEPELGLHPYAITLLAALLRSAATKTQVIVSTQSVPLVNQFTPEEIIVVDRQDGQSTFERRTIEDLAAWLEDYGMGDLWEKNLLGGRPR